MTEAYLSIGSNMGDRLANLQKAIQLLNVPPKIDIMAISSVYETEPVGMSNKILFTILQLRLRLS